MLFNYIPMFDYPSIIYQCLIIYFYWFIVNTLPNRLILESSLFLILLLLISFDILKSATDILAQMFLVYGWPKEQHLWNCL